MLGMCGSGAGSAHAGAADTTAAAATPSATSKWRMLDSFEFRAAHGWRAHCAPVAPQAIVLLTASPSDAREACGLAHRDRPSSRLSRSLPHADGSRRRTRRDFVG